MFRRLMQLLIIGKRRRGKTIYEMLEETKTWFDKEIWPFVDFIKENHNVDLDNMTLSELTTFTRRITDFYNKHVYKK